MAGVNKYKLDSDGFSNLFVEKPSDHLVESIGFDSGSVFESDLVSQVRELYKDYTLQPQIIDSLPIWRIPAAFDGMGAVEIPKLNEMNKPIYVMAPERHDVTVDGTKIRIPKPQLVTTSTDFLENWKQPFAGQSRVGMTLMQMDENLQEVRQIVGFNGKSSIAQTNSQSIGLVAGAYTTITAAGIWDVDANSNGILDNPKTVFEDLFGYFSGNGLGDKPMVIAMTQHPELRLRTAEPTYEPSYGNMKEWILKKCPPGSRILPPTNDLQCTVSTDTYTTSASAASGTMLVMLDMGSQFKQGAVAVESGVQNVAKEIDVWGYTYAKRKIYATSVVDQKKVVAVSSIDITS